MRMSSAKFAAVLGLCLCSAVASAWPTVPLPEHSQGEIVTSHMENNGLEMRASRFQTRQSVEQVADFYRQEWGRDIVENHDEGRILLGHAAGRHFVTVDLTRSGSYTEGTIGIAKLLAPGEELRAPGEGFIRPAGTEVLSDVRYFDVPGEPRTLAMRNEHSPYVNHQYYRERLYPRGWQAVGPQDCRAHSDVCMSEFENGNGGRILISMKRTGPAETDIVVQTQ